MSKKTLPVYNIKDFKDPEHGTDFYANSMKRHLRDHHIILTPHKHDFFLTVLFTKGSGTHEIDFTNYKVEPGAIFMLRPGQTHNWKLSKETDGFVFFHTKDFYDSRSVTEKTQDFPFFSSIHNPPLLLLKNKRKEKIEDLFSEIKKEYEENNLLKFQKLYSLVALTYIELTRSYQPQKQIKSEIYLLKLRQLEDLIDKNYKNIKAPHHYAKMMAMTEKHLNRICNTCLNKTTTELISNRVILEAKRLLTHSKVPINQVAEELGYLDNSYFSRFFKKQTGQSPLDFMRAQRR
ncbi:MAG: helix-turn-helix domain-containing protein [Bacteroidetes bacterium]|nr:helix-turn-helix domain-containing protein [Bacteroidota bacterium]